MPQRIAIMGAGGNIAKGLISEFIKLPENHLTLFTRKKKYVERFVNNLRPDIKASYKIIEGYNSFHTGKYDIIINCIGAGHPGILNEAYYNWFLINEQFDYTVLNYLEQYPESMYINFSSGAVYGQLNSPASFDLKVEFPVNKLCAHDFYSLMNLNTEARHRAFSKYRIIDIRIFSYCSTFIDFTSKYFLTDLFSALLNNSILITNRIDMQRDYIGLPDLCQMISKCIKKRRNEVLNISLDAYTKAPIRKFELLDYFTDQYGLKYKVIDSTSCSSPNGNNLCYYSAVRMANHNIGYTPSESSLEVIENTYNLLNLKSTGNDAPTENSLYY